jgi:hypothetical protein
MRDADRAWQYAALFNRLGERWRMNVPVDAVTSTDGRTVYLGSARRARADKAGNALTNALTGFMEGNAHAPSEIA